MRRLEEGVRVKIIGGEWEQPIPIGQIGTLARRFGQLWTVRMDDKAFLVVASDRECGCRGSFSEHRGRMILEEVDDRYTFLEWVSQYQLEK